MTEQKKHPNYEFIVAFAEGKQLQVRVKSDKAWIDFDEKGHAGPWNASATRNIEWRIKPESRWYRVALYSANGQFWTSTVDNQSGEAAEKSDDFFVRWLTDRTEYDV